MHQTTLYVYFITMDQLVYCIFTAAEAVLRKKSVECKYALRSQYPTSRRVIQLALQAPFIYLHINCNSGAVFTNYIYGPTVRIMESIS